MSSCSGTRRGYIRAKMPGKGLIPAQVNTKSPFLCQGFANWGLDLSDSCAFGNSLAEGVPIPSAGNSIPLRRAPDNGGSALPGVRVRVVESIVQAPAFFP